MSDAAPPAPTERGWGKLLLALAAFLFLPHIPPLNVMLPVEDTLLLLLPAIAACCLVGWWAGGRLLLALVWVGLAVRVMTLPAAPGSIDNIVRGWCLLLAGAFGLISLFGIQRPFLNRALTAVGLALGLVLLMTLRGPFTVGKTRSALQMEFAKRSTSTAAFFRNYARQNPDANKQMPQLAPMLDEFEQGLKATSEEAVRLAPSLVLLESLTALALAWTTYHRIARTRLGAPLGPLKDFRFNDQLVWGLIAGLAIVFVPGLDFMNGVGRNLLVFFGALYAIRGLGVLSWFMPPGAFATVLGLGFIMLWWPVLNAVAFTLLALAAFGLGLGDTWADWRRRARPTT
jgi:hypothetical protein